MRIEFTDEQKKRLAKMINFSYCWGISKHVSAYHERLKIYYKAKDFVNGFELSDYFDFIQIIKRQHKKEAIDIVVKQINDSGYYSSKEIKSNI